MCTLLTFFSLVRLCPPESSRTLSLLSLRRISMRNRSLYVIWMARPGQSERSNSLALSDRSRTAVGPKSDRSHRVSTRRPWGWRVWMKPRGSELAIGRGLTAAMTSSHWLSRACRTTCSLPLSVPLSSLCVALLARAKITRRICKGKIFLLSLFYFSSSILKKYLRNS